MNNPVKYKTAGIIFAIPPSEQRGEYTIQKLVLSVAGYNGRTETPVFEFFGKKADLVQGFREGDKCEITWELKGNQSRDGGRFYTTLSAFEIRRPFQSESSGDRPPKQERRPAPARAQVQHPEDGRDDYDF